LRALFLFFPHFLGSPERASRALALHCASLGPHRHTHTHAARAPDSLDLEKASTSVGLEELDMRVYQVCVCCVFVCVCLCVCVCVSHLRACIVLLCLNLRIKAPHITDSRPLCGSRQRLCLPASLAATGAHKPTGAPFYPSCADIYISIHTHTHTHTHGAHLEM
jgi:hypothetical protein